MQIQCVCQLQLKLQLCDTFLLCCDIVAGPPWHLLFVCVGALELPATSRGLPCWPLAVSFDGLAVARSVVCLAMCAKLNTVSEGMPHGSS